nr:SdpI family protein [uncultured Anaerostipes sp.]
MLYSIFIYISLILIPLTMICFGLYFRHGGPKKINPAFGYRTSRSMKNEDTWRFAHQHCGKIWFRWGILLLIITSVFYFYRLMTSSPAGLSEDKIVIAQVVVLILSILPTELALRKTFDRQGNRKHHSV